MKTPVTENHEQRETITQDVILPGHDPRVTTPLFSRTRKLLIEREGNKCWLTQLTPEETGAPHEAHHHPVERCFATMVDWPRFAKDAKALRYGPHAAAFDWDNFLLGAEVVTVGDITYTKVRDPYLFVDDMTVNGLLLAKKFHTGGDEGIHDLTFPVWLAQGYLVEGYKLSAIEVIHHAQGD